MQETAARRVGPIKTGDGNESTKQALERVILPPAQINVLEQTDVTAFSAMRTPCTLNRYISRATVQGEELSKEVAALRQELSDKTHALDELQGKRASEQRRVEHWMADLQAALSELDQLGEPSSSGQVMGCILQPILIQWEALLISNSRLY